MPHLASVLRSLPALLLSVAAACTDEPPEGPPEAPPGVETVIALGGPSELVAYTAAQREVEIRDGDGTLVAAYEGDYASIIARPDGSALIDRAPDQPSRALVLDRDGRLVRRIDSVRPARYLAAGDGYLAVTADGAGFQARRLDRNFGVVAGAPVATPTDTLLAARDDDLIVAHDDGDRVRISRHDRAGALVGEASVAADHAEALVAGGDGYLVIYARDGHRFAQVLRDGAWVGGGAALGVAIGPLATATAVYGYAVAKVEGGGLVTVLTLDRDGASNSDLMVALRPDLGALLSLSMVRVRDGHLIAATHDVLDARTGGHEVTIRAVTVERDGAGPVRELARSRW